MRTHAAHQSIAVFVYFQFPPSSYISDVQTLKLLWSWSWSLVNCLSSPETSGSSWRCRSDSTWRSVRSYTTAGCRTRDPAASPPSWPPPPPAGPGGCTPGRTREQEGSCCYTFSMLLILLPLCQTLSAEPADELLRIDIYFEKREISAFSFDSSLFTVSVHLTNETKRWSEGVALCGEPGLLNAFMWPGPKYSRDTRLFSNSTTTVLQRSSLNLKSCSSE